MAEINRTHWSQTTKHLNQRRPWEGEGRAGEGRTWGEGEDGPGTKEGWRGGQ